MTIGAIPPAEVAIDPSLVRALLREQHTDLVHLALVDIGEGWDNGLFRLGDDLAIRLPRRAVSAALVEHEQRWLPLLAPRLPLPIPAPLRIGRPGCGFPWYWSAYPGSSVKAPRVCQRKTRRRRRWSWADFFTRSTNPHREMLRTTRGEACLSRLVRRQCENTSGRSTASWTAPRCLVCGNASLRRLRGRGRDCGSTAIFTPAICWSAAAVSRP